MTGRLLRAVFWALILLASAKAATVVIDKEHFFVVNGERVFPFFFMLAPPPDARTPSGADAWRVLFEDPRKVAVTSDGFDDWFGPNEVHVYRFAKTKKKE